MTDPKYMRPGLDFARGKAIEELGELQAALGKSLRWGWTSYNPELPPVERVINAKWVRDEMRDVRGALDNLESELDNNWLAMPAVAETRRTAPEDNGLLHGISSDPPSSAGERMREALEAALLYSKEIARQFAERFPNEEAGGTLDQLKRDLVAKCAALDLQGPSGKTVTNPPGAVNE